MRDLSTAGAFPQIILLWKLQIFFASSSSFSAGNPATCQDSQIQCCLCTFKILIKQVNRQTAPDLNGWWSGSWNRKFVSETQLGRTASGLAAAKGTNKGRGTKQKILLTMDKGQCSRGDKCGMKHDPEIKREPKGKGRVATVELSTNEVFGKRDFLAKSLSGRKTQP